MEQTIETRFYNSYEYCGGRFFAVFLCMLIAINIHDQNRVKFIEQSAIETVGMVSEKNCSNHGAYYYSYMVDGKEYKSPTASCRGAPCKELKIGDPVRVVYSSTKPQWSFCKALD